MPKLPNQPACGWFQLHMTPQSRLYGMFRALGAGVDLKEFDIDNKYGKQALDRMSGIIVGTRAPLETITVWRPCFSSCISCASAHLQ